MMPFYRSSRAFQNPEPTLLTLPSILAGGMENERGYACRVKRQHCNHLVNMDLSFGKQCLRIEAG
jgi:hypothetical protein